MFHKILVFSSAFFLSSCALLENMQKDLCERGEVEINMTPTSGVVEMCNRHTQGNPVEPCCIYTGTVTSAYSACKVVNGSKVTLKTRTWNDGSNGTFGNGAIGGVLHVDRLSSQTINNLPEAIERPIRFDPPPAFAESSSTAGITYNVKPAISSPINSLACGTRGCVVSDYTVTIFPVDSTPSVNSDEAILECPTEVKLTHNIVLF